MLAAMDNPYLTIIGHPTGRLLLSRDPYPIDLDAVIDEGRGHRRGPGDQRRPPPARPGLAGGCGEARDGGVTISIGADAHSVAGLGYVDFGVGMARKAWLGREHVLNARPVEEFVAFARRRR